MPHIPADISTLLARYPADRRRLGAEADGTARLCREYCEPLLRALGWDVVNKAGAAVQKRAVDRLTLEPPLAAYLLHEQAFRYQRHYLLGVCQPPLARYSSALLEALEPTLRRSQVLIETLALTDFGSFDFYDTTPPEPGPLLAQRARLYSLPMRHYPAWWGELSFPASLFSRRRLFDLYAAKLRNWGGYNGTEWGDEPADK